jgi:cytochrome c556
MDPTALPRRHPLAVRIRLALFCLSVGLLGTGLATATRAADEPPSKGEQAIKYRKSIYQVILWNFMPMSQMAQEKSPYDAADFAERSKRVNAMTYMLSEAYPVESQSGAPTRAKAEIWTNRTDFDSKLQALQDKSAALAKVAADGEFAASRAAFFETANACKNCHDKYRNE